MKTTKRTLRGRVATCALALTLAIGLMPIGAFAAIDEPFEASAEGDQAPVLNAEPNSGEFDVDTESDLTEPEQLDNLVEQEGSDDRTEESSDDEPVHPLAGSSQSHESDEEKEIKSSDKIGESHLGEGASAQEEDKVLSEERDEVGFGSSIQDEIPEDSPQAISEDEPQQLTAQYKDCMLWSGQEMWPIDQDMYIDTLENTAQTPLMTAVQCRLWTCPIHTSQVLGAAGIISSSWKCEYQCDSSYSIKNTSRPTYTVSREKVKSQYGLDMPAGITVSRTEVAVVMDEASIGSFTLTTSADFTRNVDFYGHTSVTSLYCGYCRTSYPLDPDAPASITASKTFTIYNGWGLRLHYSGYTSGLFWEYPDNGDIANTSFSVPLEESNIPSQAGSRFRYWQSDTGGIYKPGDTFTCEFDNDAKQRIIKSNSPPYIFDAYLDPVCTALEYTINYHVREEGDYSASWVGPFLQRKYTTSLSAPSFRVPKTEPTRPYSVFIGWSTKPSTDSNRYIRARSGDKLIPESYERKLDLYAVWSHSTMYSSSSIDYQLRFDRFDSTNVPDDIEVLKQRFKYAMISIPDQTPQKDGYVFQGWISEADSDDPSDSEVRVYQPGDVVMLFARNANQTVVSETLVPLWDMADMPDNPADPIDYRLSFDANGGYDAPASLEILGSYYEYERFSIPEQLPKRDGYSFLGWKNHRDLSNPNGWRGHPGDTVTLYSVDPEVKLVTKTLYAEWEEDRGTVDSDPPEGNGELDEPDMPPEEITEPDDPGATNDPDDPNEPPGQVDLESPADPQIPDTLPSSEAVADRGTEGEAETDGPDQANPSVEEERAGAGLHGLQALAQTDDPALRGVLLSTSITAAVLLALMAGALHKRRRSTFPKE